jgi:hypothetical protein
MLSRFYYARLNTDGTGTFAESIFLFLFLPIFAAGCWSIGRVFVRRSRTRLISVACALSCFCACYIWSDDSLGDRFIDQMDVPEQPLLARLAAGIEAGALKPDGDRYVKLPERDSRYVLGGSASLLDAGRDSRIVFPLREFGSSVLCAIYEPRQTFRPLGNDRDWWRRVSRKSDHWYLALNADWD